MKSWTYHICLKTILWICRKDSFYATMFIGEADVLRKEMKISGTAVTAASNFIKAIRDHVDG